MDLKQKTTSKLISELKALKAVTSVLILVLGFLVGINIYGILMKDEIGTFIAGIAVAIALSAILPLQYANIKKIKAELRLRNNSI